MRIDISQKELIQLFLALTEYRVKNISLMEENIKLKKENALFKKHIEYDLREEENRANV